jgi:hypothetical protein
LNACWMLKANGDKSLEEEDKKHNAYMWE